MRFYRGPSAVFSAGDRTRITLVFDTELTDYWLDHPLPFEERL